VKRSSASEENADIQRDLEAELVAEKQINNDLRETVKTQRYKCRWMR
jgi:hypothetical protein